MNRSPLIIGHRGAMAYAPENTPASFEMAWRMGADAVECDVHLSKDGQPVVMHDESLDRTSSGTGLIRDHAWARLRGLDAGGWFHRKFRGQRMWRLRDLLDWARGKTTPRGRPLGLLLELKNEEVRYPGMAEAVTALLDAGGWADRVWVISFDHGVVKRVKRLRPDLRTGLLFHQPLPDAEARVDWTGADGLFPRWSVATPALARLARRRGLFLGTYTVNDVPLFKKMRGLGVDGVITNRPDLLLSLARPGD